ncbi:MAG: Thiamine-binding periplasmic protein precursor [Candidatus Heimdallarchaeota archaeon LC_3]|nr:MAG: Thiamine-binding periplasmic protein precursor [Candidatus Heimdallarchaeota archaeon LC_3]
MKNQNIIFIIGIISVLIVSTVFFAVFIFNEPVDTSRITVYRYQGFMGFGDINSPVYNSSAIDEKIFNEWGEKNGYKVKIVDTNDANALLSLLTLESNNPKADVVIGLDNALLALAKAEGYANQILEPYRPKNSSQIRTDLVDQLDPNFLLTPIDYGALGFYYDTSIINDTIIPNLNNLTIDDLTDPTIASQLILEDALSSSPGTGFLLWSIASHKMQNNLDSWETFWALLIENDDILITPSWNEGFNALLSQEVNRSILLSYATSPAYDNCIFDYNGTATFFTKENGTTNSWLQIEGIGLVKNSPNPDAGKKFIDWMISSEVQKIIPVTNWMYPANTIAQNELPACFNEAAINPDDLFTLNNVLRISEVQNNIANWLEKWDIIIAGGSNYLIIKIHQIFINDNNLISVVLRKD